MTGRRRLRSLGGDLNIQVVLPLALGAALGVAVVAVVAALMLRDVTPRWVDLTGRLVLLWALLSAGMLYVAGVIVSRRVSRPLARLTESARRVAEDDDYSWTVDAEGSDEVAQLARTFNQMTASLRERRDSLTHKVGELTALYDMSRSLAATLDLDVLLGSVLDSALRIFEVEAGSVTLRDRSSGRLELRAWRGPDAPPDEAAVRDSMGDWVVREGRPLIFNPTGAPGDPADTATGAVAALCVPLLSSDGAIGAITVGSADETARFTGDDVRLLATIANQVSMALGNVDLFSSLQEAYIATVRSLAAAVDAKDRYTRGHSDRVAAYSLLVADEMGLGAEQRTALEMAAYLHDIGKIGIPGDILLKPGALDDEERGRMKHHPLIGANILTPVAFPWPIVPIIRHHHEAWDGTGYPAGLRAEEIPLPARILTVADSYEAMTSDRPYRRGLMPEVAVAELIRCSGSQFDPVIVDAFIRALRAAGPVRRTAPHPSDIRLDEARTVFVALYEGMVGSFERLGGPRLAENLAAEVEAAFREREEPFSFHNGRLLASWDGAGDDAELALMRLALGRLAAAMERFTGPGLIEGFYREAIDDLPEHLRSRATSLAFLAGPIARRR